MRRQMAASAVVVVLSIVAGNARCLAQYSVTDLGTLPGCSDCVATAINASGEVAGYCVDGDNDRAFLYSHGTMTSLGTLGGFAGSQATGINDSGQVVGQCISGNWWSYQAFLYSNGKMTAVATGLGASTSTASGINVSGQVVGHFDAADGYRHAFLYSNGATTDLGTLGGSDAFASAINASGQVAGYIHSLNNSYPLYSPIVYSSGTTVNLGNVVFFADSNGSSATDINASGQVVGYYYRGNYAGTFLYSNGQMMNLGWMASSFESYGYGINDSGQIVGMSVLLSNGTIGFLYSNGAMTDLNSLVPPGSPDILGANAINDSGQIAGYGINSSGNCDALLLTPLPPGDANGDDRVDVNDLTIVLTNFGQTGCTWWQGCMDDDPSGAVDINDLTIVVANFGTTAGAGASLPSPSPPPFSKVHRNAPAITAASRTHPWPSR